jgi:hypothetical protein
MMNKWWSPVVCELLPAETIAYPYSIGVLHRENTRVYTFVRDRNNIPLEVERVARIVKDNSPRCSWLNIEADLRACVARTEHMSVTSAQRLLRDLDYWVMQALNLGIIEMVAEERARVDDWTDEQ